MKAKKEDIKNRVNKIVDYIIENKCTIKQASEFLNINKGLVKSDLQTRLDLIDDINKIEQVKEILRQNKTNIKKGFNEYKIVDDYVIIYLHRRNGDILETYIDLEDLEKTQKYDTPFYAKYYKNIDGFYAVATLYKGMKNQGEYIYKELRLHKLVMDYTGKDKVDHINHNTLDNRKENLRIASNDKNTKHRHGKNSNNTSGYRNVTWIEREHKWIVQLQVNGKNTVLGKFKYGELEQAGKFAEEMREKYYKEYKGAS